MLSTSIKVLAAASLACCALSHAALEAENTPDQILTFDGLGPVRIGMTPSQAEEALGAKFSPKLDFEEDSCWYAHRADGVDPQVYYMVQDNEIVRIDIEERELGKTETVDPYISTEKGIRVGSTEEQIKEGYGAKVEISPHPYLEEAGHYLEVLRSDMQRGLLFETNDNKVTTFRSGTPDAIRLIEGCS